ncbi:MAG: DUF222 domain-containing protein [Actinomycetota bacterium]
MYDDPINDHDAITTRELLEGFDRSSAVVGAAQRRHLAFIVACDAARVWADDDCRDIAHWVALRDGISTWKAQRMVAAGYALKSLPAICRALEDGVLSLDKVVELTRFATPYDEDDLIAWASRVAPAAIREKADAARRLSDEELRQNRWRELRWWWEDDGSRMSLWGSLPADKGAVVAKALDRLAEHIPELPDDVPSWTEDGPSTIDARRADALVAMASATIAADPDPDRATLVVHAELSALIGDGPSGVIAGGPAIPPQMVQRLACDCRLQAVLHGQEGGIVSIGTTARNIPPWLRRQVEHRDGYRCTFPGCGAKRFVEVHHIVPWPKGPTEIGNLLCACSFHHDLLHLHGWHAGLGVDGAARWFRPDWTPYEPRPAPAALPN